MAINLIIGLVLQTVSGMAGGYFLYKDNPLIIIAIIGYLFGLYTTGDSILKLLFNTNEEPWECSLIHEREG